MSINNCFYESCSLGDITFTNFNFFFKVYLNISNISGNAGGPRISLIEFVQRGHG
jgi:hypothetical protein